MKCSQCASAIGVFSPEWQSQRETGEKTCPSCGAAVEPVFGGIKFAKWFLGSGAIVAAITFAMTRSAVLAVLNGFFIGVCVALLPSIELRRRKHFDSGIRHALNRPLTLPSWLSSPDWLGLVAKATWAACAKLLLLAAIALSVPPPWSGVLLIVLGAFGILPWGSSPGASKAAKLGAVCQLVAGLAILVRYSTYLLRPAATADGCMRASGSACALTTWQATIGRGRVKTG